MGSTHSKKGVEGGLNASVPHTYNLPVPVHDHDEAERKEESSSSKDGYNGHGFCNLRQVVDDHDGHASSGMAAMAAKLSTWSKVHNLLPKYKDKNVGNRKYVDRSYSFHTVNVKDVEHVAKVQAEPKVGIWQRVTRSVKVADESFSLLEKLPENAKWKREPSGDEADKVVLYFTSLRGIRKTFDDCCIVKLILGCFGVLVDERDISMHAPFRQELQDLLGMPITVPSLFIAGKYIGGIEEIQQLHENGELAKYLEGFPLHTCSTRPCHGCGDARFVPCLNCDGSRKVFTEEKGGQTQGLFMRCRQCNENGLIRCPLCCVAAFQKI